MNIVVCVKSVLKEAPEAAVARTPDLCELNPYDRPALSLARELAGELSGSVTALTMGAPDPAGDALLEAMAMGADRGVLVADKAIAGSDTLATSTVLAAAIAKIGRPDLVLFGVRSVDSDTGHVGPQTATMLGLPFVGGVTSCVPGDEGIEIERTADGYIERYRMKTPGALSVLPKAAPLAYVPLGGIEDAYTDGSFETWSAGDLGLVPERIGLPGSPTLVMSMSKVKRERKCEFIEGPADEIAERLVAIMTEDGLL